MKIIIATKNFERIGMIENAEIIWTTRYYKSGDFEIYFSATEDNLALINNGFYVIRDDIEENNIGIIEDYEIANKPEEGDMITMTGRLADGYFLNMRVVQKQTQMSGNVQQSIRNLIYSNIVNPTDKNRKINFIKLGELDNTITETLERQSTGDNLLQLIEEISEEKGIGFKATFKDALISYEVYKGIDRSYNQSKNPYVVFSDSYDNLTEAHYIKTSSLAKNFAYVAGEGEGLDRRIVLTYNTAEEPTGEDRFETWVDQRNISSNNENITEDELINQMKEEGLENLSTIREAFEGGVQLRGYTYREDFDLGDLVQLYKRTWGIGVAMRIIECIESIDKTGTTVVLTFGI